MGAVGTLVGAAVGAVGAVVGVLVGLIVGAVGTIVGAAVGAVGADVGLAVGHAVIEAGVTPELPLNALASRLVGLLPSQHTNVSVDIDPNAFELIVVTEAGILTLVSFVPMKAKDPMLASEEQPVRSIVRSDVALSKACIPIDVRFAQPARLTVTRDDAW